MAIYLGSSKVHPHMGQPIINKGIKVINVGSGPIEVGYFMDEACTIPATMKALIEIADNPIVYRKFMKPVSWSSGSDADIQAMISAAKAETADLTKHWSVGDTRTVHLSAMAATGVGESHVEQDVEIVLMHKNWIDANGVTHPFLWGLKDGLANGTSGEFGYMNSSGTSSGGWNGSQRCAWCNGIFFSALPAYMQDATGTTAVKTATGAASSITTISLDKCFLPAEFEVFGANTHANSAAESGLTHIEYYKIASNRIKKCGPSGSASSWFERSPFNNNYEYFCMINYAGTVGYGNANNNYLIVPHGCIL